MITRTLESTAVEAIHEAFVDAFSEYEVKIDMPLEKLKEMLRVRDYEPSLSLGCFEGDRLIGFVLTGCRELDGQKCGYDAGTGIIKEYQNQHIGSTLLRELEGVIGANGIDRYQLEVLENNRPAQRLYEKHGFRVSRRLRCYSLDTAGRPADIRAPFAKSNDPGLLDGLDIDRYVSFAPTWQNSRETFGRMRGKCHFESWHDGGKTVGYGIVQKGGGDILQLGVGKEYRGMGLEAMLVKSLASAVSAARVTMLNLEDASYMQIEAEKMGCRNYVNQFEMVYGPKPLDCGTER